ncbi:hypothetical protein SUGI_1121570 [Cryptomeria japonica]|nr:hypothetical protein SUGI_1121570 [Cryptomeria japonica]
MLGTIGALAVVLGIFSIVMWRKHRLRSTERYGDSSNSFLRMFSYKELKIATRNFSSKLGSGGFGSVFRGTLTDGTLVAVKKMEGSSQDDKQFRAEISSLGNVQHVNLVRLRGFCAEGSRRLLIYDFMANGSLDSLLFTSDSKTERKINHGKTINIVEEGVAEEADIEEVRRASIVGLLCIEEDEYMRPNMGQVVRMLEGKLEPRTLQIQKSLPEEEQAEQSQTSTDSCGNGIS